MNSPIRCVLGMDLGTSSLKCVILDARGRLLADVARSYPTQTPHPGWAEQDPNDWIDATRSAMAELRAREPLLLDSLSAVGLCSAAHLPVLLDSELRIIRPAILWSDQRSDAQVIELQRDHATLLRQITLNEAGCTWTLPQLRWIGHHEPEHLARTRWLLSSKDYLLFRLTGELRMDHGSAAATLMSDGRQKSWSPEVSALSGLPASAFPRLYKPQEVAGRITAEAAHWFGLPPGIPVAAGALDSAAEMLGCGILRPGETGMVRVGSAGGIMAVTQAATFNQGIITYPHVVDGLYYKQAGTNACATSLKWLRELANNVPGLDAAPLQYDDLDHLAETAQAGADGLMFHPYLQGERAPHWNPELRGSFTGIDLRQRWPQWIRAVMEGVAFSLLDGLSMFRRDGLDMTSAVMSGGVTKSALWSQIITDVLGMPTHTVQHGDSALGAAMLAAIASGTFANIDEAVSACVKQERMLLPNPLHRERYAQLFARYQETGKCLDALSRKFGA